MNTKSFTIARLPRIEFGAGTISKLVAITSRYGDKVLLVTGASSFIASSIWEKISSDFTKASISYEICHINTEPSPQLIDEIVDKYRQDMFDVVVAIGGGSALDAAKAIAGLLKINNSVMDFLEGVGPELNYTGPSVPFIAVPTTAGTGSEATKNAVLSLQRFDGFKKSFRDEMLVPEYAIIDPDLLSSCRPGLIAANGMDALTQLMESFVSIKAGALTDALAISGIEAVRDSLLDWYNGNNSADNRAKMAYASMLSGINLAQTGLGSVHGLAAPLGAFFPIPHGVVCGTLVHEATAININAMQQRDQNNPALEKYASLGRLLSGELTLNSVQALEALLTILESWTKQMDLPRLSEYGVRLEQLDHVVANSRGSSMQTNPVVLTDDEIRQILIRRL